MTRHFFHYRLLRGRSPALRILALRGTGMAESLPRYTLELLVSVSLGLPRLGAIVIRLIFGFLDLHHFGAKGVAVVALWLPCALKF